jgi:hypothetical protein
MWAEKGDLPFEGNFGQIAMLIPKKDAVIVPPGSPTASTAFWRGVLPSYARLRGPAVLNCEPALDRLKEKLSKLRIAWGKSGSPAPPQQALVNQRQILFPPNNYSFLPERRFYEPAFVGKNFGELYRHRACQLDFTENAVISLFRGHHPQPAGDGLRLQQEAGCHAAFPPLYEGDLHGPGLMRRPLASTSLFAVLHHGASTFPSAPTTWRSVCCEKPKGSGGADLLEKVFFCALKNKKLS